MADRPVALVASEAAVRRKRSHYPEPFAARVEGREKRPLGDAFGLRSFGVNQTRLAPGSMSALRHAHSTQDEFVFVLAGEATLVTEAGDTLLTPGMCAGFAAGDGNGHHLVNRSEEDVVFLEMGDRAREQGVEYPDDDLRAVQESGGGWVFTHKDGAAY